MSDRFIWVFASNVVDKRDYSRTSINRILSTYNGHFFCPAGQSLYWLFLNLSSTPGNSH